MTLLIGPLSLALMGTPVPAEAPVPVAVAPAEAAPAVSEPVSPPAPVAADPLPKAAGEAVDPTAIVVTAPPRSEPGDPLRSVNAVSFSAVQSVDKAFVGPVALAYKDAIPEPVRDGLRNVLDNLQEPVVFLNYLLQLKPGKAVETLGRFTINSTIGVAGLVDVAKRRPFRLPRHPNGFAFTLGYYGVKPGAFLFLPLIGPTTVRDLIGRVIDLSLLPTVAGKPFNRPLYSLTTTTIRSLDERAQSDEQLNRFRNETSDPYGALRDAYMKNRQAEIDALHGKPRDAAAPAPRP